MKIFKNNPTIIPGITHNIGSQTGPNKTPKIRKLEEYIHPTVTKYAENTNGRKENGSFPPPTIFKGISHRIKI
jgi:hypothetical protein